MHVCIYVCICNMDMYVCIHVCVYNHNDYIYTYIYLYICIYIYIQDFKAYMKQAREECAQVSDDVTLCMMM